MGRQLASLVSKQRCEIVAIAGSAGGLTALATILGGLPRGFPLPVVVMLHLEPHRASLLTEILSRRTELRVAEAEDGMPLRPSWAFVAPPDHHLKVTKEHSLRLSNDPPVHWVRPSADVLFDSVAEVYGSTAVGVLCSGTGKDGAAGLRALWDRGALTLVQDRNSCRHFGMPGEAIRLGAAQEVLPLEALAPRLLRAARC